MSGINDCKEFDFVNDTILWSESINQPKERMDFYKEHYGVDLK